MPAEQMPPQADSKHTEEENPSNNDVPPMVSLDDLDSQESILSALQECSQREAMLEMELVRRMEEIPALSKRATSIVSVAEPVLESVSLESQALARTVSQTSLLAERISKKVRELDISQTRAQEVIKRVEDIMDVKNCIEGVQSAMATENFEAAAAHISRFLNFGELMDEEEARDVLSTAEVKMKEIVRQRIGAAAQANNEEEVVRFCKLFPPLGIADEGLTAYCDYVKSCVGRDIEEEMKQIEYSLDLSVNKSQSMVPFVDVLTKLFENIAFTIQDSEEFVETSFGEGSLLYVVRALQAECDSQSSRLLKRFVESRQLEARATQVAKMQRDRMYDSNNAQSAPVIDPRELDALLDEIALLSQRSEQYDKYVRRVAKQAFDNMEKPTRQRFQEMTGTADGMLHVSALNKSVQEIVGHYVGMEEYFMEENIKKAQAIDALSPGSMTSSVVDDVFYILQKCARRSIGTGSVMCVCAVVNFVNSTVNGEYKQMLVKRLDEYNNAEQLSHRLFAGDILGGASGNSSSILEPWHVASLNNVDVSSEYLGKLKGEIEGGAENHFEDAMDIEKIKPALNELTETASSFRHLLKGGLGQLGTILAKKARSTMDSLYDINYVLDEKQFSDYEVNDPFASRLIMELENNLLPLQDVLTPGNFDGVTLCLIEVSAKRLEKIIKRKKFNHLGGLQLEKDVRTLINFFAKMCSRTVRDKFSRLTQVAWLLNLERVGEIMDYLGDSSGSITWKLNAAEIKEVLRLRVDFGEAAIAKLKI